MPPLTYPPSPSCHPPLLCAGATYRVDLADGPLTAQPALFRRTELKVPHSAEDYTTTQVSECVGGGRCVF